jgi:hypothetical protein
MHHKILARVAAVALLAGVVAPVTAIAVGAGTASASGGTQVTCTSLKGSATGNTTLSDCTTTLAGLFGTGKSAEKPGKGTASATTTCESSCTGGWDVITDTSWGKKGVGGTDTAGSNYTLSGPGAGTPCGTKETTITETGSVLSGTGVAAALAGDSSSGTVCLSSKGALKNPKGYPIDS